MISPARIIGWSFAIVLGCVASVSVVIAALFAVAFVQTLVR